MVAQTMAIRHPGRVRSLGSLTSTTGHRGTEDPMCHPSGGRATAEAIPDARLELITGMGHDLPRGAWPQFIRAIAGDASRAEAS
jgi:pimeloyl-ACP methyl ester carboxylesterase